MKALARISFLSILSIFLMIGSAFAAPFMFDFNDIDGTNYTVKDIFPGTDMTISAYNAGPLTYDSSDHGIGIGDDEVSGGFINNEQWNLERLRFSFTETVYISDFYIVDLFPNEGNNGEIGRYRIDQQGPTYSFGPGANNGDYTLSLNTNLNDITFFANADPINDFAVAGFDGEPVPEPGTVVLLALGLAGLGYAGRKKKMFKN